MHNIFLIIYYFVLKHLPSTSMPFGSCSNLIRSFFCKLIFKKVGNKTVIKRGVYFGNGKEIVIGNNSQLGENCRVPNNIIIGNNVMMGFECVFFGVKHRISLTNKPFIDQGYEKVKPIIVEDNVWIGARTIVLPGIKIKKNCIIGAGSVLTKNTESNYIYGGVPAIKIKKLN